MLKRIKTPVDGCFISFEEAPDVVWTVRCFSQRYAVCTRPQSDQDKVDNGLPPWDTNLWYSIIDNERLVRGPHNKILNEYNFQNDKDCRRCMNDLIMGQIDITYIPSKYVRLHVFSMWR